jgi:hypothetical protein
MNDEPSTPKRSPGRPRKKAPREGFFPPTQITPTQDQMPSIPNTEWVHIDTLLPDPSNPRKHGPKNLESIKASLARFGQQDPILATRDRVVRVGNGRLLAAKALGWPLILVQWSNLKGSEAVAFAIAHNRTAELAEWDFDILGATFNGLKDDGWSHEDLSRIGFDDQSLKNMFPEQRMRAPILKDPVDLHLVEPEKKSKKKVDPSVCPTCQCTLTCPRCALQQPQAPAP